METPPVVNERICQFYLQPRGCIKGASCDFKHPLSPQGQATNKVCEYFLKARGCSKGAECDFLHPDVQPEQKLLLQAQLPPKGRPCQYFNSPRGCIKGASCDFAHPQAFGMNHQMGFGMNGGMNGGMSAYGMNGLGSMQQVGMQGVGLVGGPKICEFFQTQRGCNKGLACDFAHVPPQQLLGMSGGAGMTPIGPVSRSGKLMKPKLCEYFGSPRGCIKAATCEFIHQQQKPCEFALSGRGCKKGKFCDFLHVDDNGTPFPGIDEESLPGSGKALRPQAPSSRFAPY